MSKSLFETDELSPLHLYRTWKAQAERILHPYLYFMPVCFAVDSLREMWCWGVKVPRLRAMIATVRNLARAAFTTLGAVELCLLRSRSSPFRLFKLCSVQAMETCIASPGSAQSLSERQNTGSHGGWAVGGFCWSFHPSLLPLPGMPSEESSLPTSEPGRAGVAAGQDRVRGTERSKQPALKLSRQLERGSGSQIFAGSNLGWFNSQIRAVGRLSQTLRAEHSCWLHAALPGAGPRRLNAGSLLGDGSDPRRHTAGCAASTLWTTGRMLNWRVEHPKKQLISSLCPGTCGLHPLRLSGPSPPRSRRMWGLSRPLPTHSQAEAWILSPQGRGFAAARRSRRVPLRSSLPLCATGRQGSLSPDSRCNKIWRAAHKKGSAQTQTKSSCSTTVGTGGRQSGGASATKHASELTREYSVTGLLTRSLKCLLLALPGFPFARYFSSR